MSEESRAASMPKGLESTPARAADSARPEPSDSDPTGQSLAVPRPPLAPSEPPARKARVALRIPDDEVARPEARSSPGAAGDSYRAPPPSVPAPPRPSPSPLPPSTDAPLVPARIISINPPAPPPEAAAQAAGEQAAQPAKLPDLPAVAPVPLSLDPEGLEDEAWGADDERATPVPVKREPPPTPRAPAPDGEEVRFEDDVPTPALPPVAAVAAKRQGAEPEHRSEPGDAPEVSPEDLVAVESVPAPAPMLAPTSIRPAPPPKKAPPKPPLVIVPPNLGALVAQPVDQPGSKRKGRLWWEDFFNDDYVRTMEKITDAQIAREASFIEDSLGVERGGALLDLGCGMGRHAVELATRGYEVVGFDLSLAMLSRAGDEAQDRGVKLNFVQGDMREMAFEEQFDGVFCWNTSFGYFEEEKNIQVVTRVHKALKTGGLFLLDVINRDFLVRQSPSLAWFEGDGCVCMDDMVVDFITSRMRVKRTMMFDDGRTREVEYSIRVYGLHELGKILHDNGFKVCEVSGRLATPGVFFGNESPRTIIVAEKR
jgi:SAM-dependent methyltransferase